MTIDEAELRAVLDEHSIIRTMHRYCRALDSGSEHEWLDVFTEDATYDTVLPDGGVYAHLTTRAEFIARSASFKRERFELEQMCLTSGAAPVRQLREALGARRTRAAIEDVSARPRADHRRRR